MTRANPAIAHHAGDDTADQRLLVGLHAGTTGLIRACVRDVDTVLYLLS
jgi:hypothetical protein